MLKFTWPYKIFSHAFNIVILCVYLTIFIEANPDFYIYAACIEILEYTCFAVSEFLAKSLLLCINKAFLSLFFSFLFPSPQFWQQEQCTWNFFKLEKSLSFLNRKFLTAVVQLCCCTEMTLNHSSLIREWVSCFPLSRINGVELPIRQVLMLQRQL